MPCRWFTSSGAQRFAGARQRLRGCDGLVPGYTMAESHQGGVWKTHLGILAFVSIEMGAGLGGVGMKGAPTPTRYHGEDLPGRVLLRGAVKGRKEELFPQ